MGGFLLTILLKPISLRNLAVAEKLGTAIASRCIIEPFEGGMQDGASKSHLDRRRGDRDRFIDRRLNLAIEMGSSVCGKGTMMNLALWHKNQERLPV
jgi:hypothetical protein